jgi:predicted nucleic acid-binding protein
MEYIDTSVLIAFIDKNDSKHYIAEDLFKNIIIRLLRN